MVERSTVSRAGPGRRSVRPSGTCSSPRTRRWSGAGGPGEGTTRHRAGDDRGPAVLPPPEHRLERAARRPYAPGGAVGRWPHPAERTPDERGPEASTERGEGDR
jgi:hypothetical protein